MAIQDEVLNAMRALGGGRLKKPGDPVEFVRVARQFGHDKAATWVETHPVEYQVLLAASAGLFEVDDEDDDDDE